MKDKECKCRDLLKGSQAILAYSRDCLIRYLESCSFTKVKLLTTTVQTIVAIYGWSRSDNMHSSPLDNWKIALISELSSYWSGM
jgi:hypothetical protein